MIVPCPACAANNRVPAVRLAETARCGQCKTGLAPLGRPVAVGSADEFDEIVRDSPLPVLVDFWADWCGPCRMVAPELERLAERQRGQVVVAKVDTEALPRVAARFGIRSIPTLILFRDGAVAHTVAGAMPAAQIERQFGLAS